MITHPEEPWHPSNPPSPQRRASRGSRRPPVQSRLARRGPACSSACFFLDLERCPRGQSGRLRLLAAITCRSVIRRLLSPLKLAPDPPPLAPARLEQGRFAWTSASPTRDDRVFGPTARARTSCPLSTPICHFFYPICTTGSRRIRLAS
jgi:hypothetical protein